MSKLLLVAALLVAAAAALSAKPNRVEWTLDGQRHAGTLRQTGDGYAPCDPSIKQHSGYFDIDAATDKHYFFWAFESRGSPASDPVILWMTGGPGCSSGLAVLVENGPCHLTTDGTMYSNPYSWNDGATVIYIDQPAGVGFSYGDVSGYDHNETQVSNDMYNFMQAFYQAFPQFLQNDLFVYGESYGGHYAPATAHRILKGNEAGEGLRIPLKGLSVGNGLTAPEIQYKYYAPLAYDWCKTVKGEPCVSKDAYDQMVAALPQCVAYLDECNNQKNSTACLVANNFCGNAEMNPYFASGLNPYDIRIKCEVPGLCYNVSNVVSFYNRKDVQAALGVADRNITWAPCSNAVYPMFRYDWTRDFNQLVPDLLHAEIRVLIYAGDMDFICNWLGNKAWTVELPWSQHDQFAAAADKPWYLDEVEAGLFRTVSGGSTNMLFTFLQVHGAGHMVPMNQPQRALDMVRHFLADKPFD